MIFSALLITLLYLVTIEFAKRKFYQKIEE
jgi:hypothetical protein